MNLCSDDHAEVCFEDRHCPVCALIKQHKDEIDEMADRIVVLEEELSAAQEEININTTKSPHEKEKP